MRDSGNGLFTGSIPAEVTTGLERILYYIEARNAAGATTETPWYTIAVKSPQAGQAPPAETVAPPAPAAATPAPAAPVRASWKKPALIGGGVLLAGGAAVALSQGGGGGGGNVPSNTVAGAYGGTATIGFQVSGSNATYATHAFTLNIDAGGRVTSDTLLEGSHLADTLSGANFLLVADVEQAGMAGRIQFLGTVVNNRVAGSVQGSVSSNTLTATYSGNFTATK
jgi:hypothetical protein